MKRACAVKDEETLYEKTSNWHYEYRPTHPSCDDGKEYIVTMHVVVGPDVTFEQGSACCPLVNSEMFKDAEQDRHEWTSLLSKAAIRVETAKEPVFPSTKTRKRTIAGSEPPLPCDEKNLTVKTYELTEFSQLGELLDGATSIFCFDADHDFLLLKRLQTEDDFVSGTTIEEKEEDGRVGRYQTCFFPEQRIYHWRLKTNDIRGEWMKHKNHHISLRTLLFHHDITYENPLQATRRAIYETHAWGRIWRDVSHCEEVED